MSKIWDVNTNSYVTSIERCKMVNLAQNGNRLRRGSVPTRLRRNASRLHLTHTFMQPRCATRPRLKRPITALRPSILSVTSIRSLDTRMQYSDYYYFLCSCNKQTSKAVQQFNYIELKNLYPCTEQSISLIGDGNNYEMMMTHRYCSATFISTF